MPMRAPRICPRCGRAGCSLHRRRRDTRSATARGYGREHKKLRAQLLAESPYCIGFPRGIHGAVRVRATVMDHRVSLRRGGRTERGNVDPMCASCNGRKAVAIEGARPQAARR